MKKIFTLAFIFSFTICKSQIPFWAETFTNGCTSGCTSFNGVNGIWNINPTGANGVNANTFYFSCAENGNAAGQCGTGCVAGLDASLHVGNVSSSPSAVFFCPTGDCGASYDCTNSTVVTSKRAESPAINCFGLSNITFSFNYMERGQGALDNSTLWYFDGTLWSQLADPPNTPTTCGGVGLWTNYSIALPASANNNPNVKIGFQWVNNGDAVGSDPSLAVDDISLFTTSTFVSPSNLSVCAEDSFQLAFHQSVNDSVFWQSGPSSAGPWTYLIAPVDSILNTILSSASTVYFRAENIVQGISSFSNVVQVTCLTPQISFTNYTGTSLTVNWNYIFGHSYTISWSGGGSGMVSNVTPPVIITGLTPNVPVNVVVCHLNPLCCDSSTFSVCNYSLTETHIDPTCGNSNGSIDLTINNSVAASYLWNNGETTEDLNNISSGIYSVSVTDTSGCMIILNVTLQNSNGPLLTATHINSTCLTANGSINLTAISGIPPYNFFWSNGETTEDLFNLFGGTYTVTVIDQASCSNVLSVTVVDSSFAYYCFLSSTTPNCNSNGTITVTLNGGVAPYNYLWSNGATTSVITNLSSGNYSITVTDSVGCISVVSNYNLLQNNFDNVVEGYAFIDANANCIFDAGDTSVQGAEVEVADSGYNSFVGYAFTDMNGYYAIHVPDTGMFVTDFSPPACATSYTACYTGNIYFPAICDSVSSVNFAITGSIGYDLEVFPFCQASNPGFDKYYQIFSYDYNYPGLTDTVTTTFIYDTSLIYHYSIGLQPTWDSINHSLTWKEPNINYGGFYHCYLTVPASVSPTALLHSEFSIAPTANDCYLSNNQIIFDEPVTSSWDPNSKQVSPEGNLSSADSVLTYTIHFQNTGSDTTHFVIVRDTLSPYLNPVTVENIVASAPFTLNISGNGILQWTFNPLFLPDSASNEAMSKGFIMFSVKTKPNLPNGTVIENNASIYFDYNTPILTNTVSSSIINSVIEIDLEKGVVIYPNPATEQLTISVINSERSVVREIQIVDVVGRIERLLHSVRNDNKIIIDVSDLAAGVYFVKVKLQNGETAVKKFVKE